MGRTPAAILPLVTAGLIVIPGCLIAPPAPADPAAKPAVAARAAGRDRFAQDITAPGQTVHTNAAAAQAAPPPGPVEVAPDPAPLPVAHAGGPVQPPAPVDLRVAMAPPPPDPPLVAALRAYLNNRPDLAVECLRGFDQANQELIIRLLPAVAHAQGAKLKDPAEAAVLCSQVEAAADAVARTAPLRVKKACFVEKVQQYGVYNPIPQGYAFLPGGQVCLYAEVENAPSEPCQHPAGGNGFVTRLECGYRVRGAAGRPAGPDEPARTLSVDDPYTRSQLRDVFLRLDIQVPQQPGPYTLVLDVRDPGTGRAARTIVDFRVAGP